MAGAAEGNPNPSASAASAASAVSVAASKGEFKRMKYEELFLVETRKFSYVPSNASRSAVRSVEEALDDRARLEGRSLLQGRPSEIAVQSCFKKLDSTCCRPYSA